MKKLLVALLVLGLAAPAMAQTNFQFYGSLRTNLGFYDLSDDYARGPGGTPAVDLTIGQGGSPDRGTILGLNGQSRFGARAFVSDKVMGIVELGFRDTSGGAKTETTYLRMAWGQWNFGAGTLLFGKHYTPASFVAYSNMLGDIGDQGEAVMLLAGQPYIGRQPQIRLTVGGFQIALLEQATPPADLGYADVDRFLPRIEAAYEFTTPMLTIRPILGYQTYRATDRGFGSDHKTIESYLVGLGAKVKLGPAYINVTGSWLQNANNYGNRSIINPVSRTATAIDDAETWQGTFVVGFAFSPTMRVEAGYGISYSKVEDDAIDLDVGLDFTGTIKHTGMVYYLQAPITLAKGISITPEIGQVSRGDVKISGLRATAIPAITADDIEASQGRLTYGMVSLRIDF